MSDKIVESVKAYLYAQNRPHESSIDSIHYQELAKGKRAKKVIDKKRTNQDYYKLKTIQTPLLNHYENVDWFERDTSFDLSAYMEKR